MPSSLIGIGAPIVGGIPATPPGIRVRTGRFASLRLRQSWHPQPVKVRNGQYPFDHPVAVAPPAVAVARHLLGHILTRSPRLELAVDLCRPFPVPELNGPQAMESDPDSNRTEAPNQTRAIALLDGRSKI